MIGTINDLAGSENSSARAANLAAMDPQRALASLGDLTEGVPVVITGTRSPNKTVFPGLRETMIGASIYRLAEEIPADNPLKDQIQELALQLHWSGAEKIVRQRKARQKPKARGGK
jgi:hypothetical protein